MDWTRTPRRPAFLVLAATAASALAFSWARSGSLSAAARTELQIDAAIKVAASRPDRAPANFPQARRVLAMLSLDRDIDDFKENALLGGPAAAFYDEQVDLAYAMRPKLAGLESGYAAVYAAAGRPEAARGAPTAERLGGGGRRKPYIATSRDARLPSREELPLSHPYAIDVFFRRVRREGEAERGPGIRALYPGIVVAAASDWRGGAGIASWVSGGLSPAAGNGLVVYDPATRRFCSYFHMSELALRTGDLVEAGQLLGRGGNTGMHAREPGHGGHVHLEIFDAKRGESLSIYELRELLDR